MAECNWFCSSCQGPQNYQLTFLSSTFFTTRAERKGHHSLMKHRGCNLCVSLLIYSFEKD